MENVLNGLQPELVFKYFEEISQIPRGSGNEKAISDYLKKFGEDLGLETIQDDTLNIIIRKPATKGYENCPGVILQGHMDMVCEKNKDTDHNFVTDPIKLRVEDDMIYATGTTLGADNGIAVAMGMAVLASNNLEHPAIEVLITTDEEAGMSGAMALQPHYINGKINYRIARNQANKIGDHERIGYYYYKERAYGSKNIRVEDYPTYRDYLSTKFFDALSKYTVGYGERPWNILIVSVMTISIFALLYMFIGIKTLNNELIGISIKTLSQHSLFEILNTYIDLWYFSMVTFTTVGYGDMIVTTTIGKILVGLEVFFGITIGAAWTSVIIKRMIR